MKLQVMSCRDCPFFRETPGVVGALLELMVPDRKSGWCAFNKRTGAVTVLELGLPPGPRRDEFLKLNQERLVIEHRDEVPAQCPLRGDPITVTLAS